MGLQALIDERDQFEGHLVSLVKERDTLVADTMTDSSERQDAILTEVSDGHKKLMDMNKQIEKEYAYDQFKRKEDRSFINAEMAQGSDMHLDMAGFIAKESGGKENIFDALSNGQLTVPSDFLMDEILISDQEMMMNDWQMGMDGKPFTDASGDGSVTRGTTRPRNRAVNPIIPPYQMNAFTSFLDVVPKIPTEDIAIQYPKLVWRASGGAAVVAENITPGSTPYTVTTASETVKEVVSLTPVTKQALRDMPQMRARLRGALRADARQKTDRMIVGTATNQEFSAGNRLLTNTEVLNVTEANGDKILEKAEELLYKIVGESYMNPNVVCVYGGDWGAIVNATRDQDNDTYYTGRPMQLFQRPVLLSAGIPTKTVISGAFSPATCQLFVKQDAQIEIGQTGTDFQDRSYHLLLTYEIAFIIYQGVAFAKYESTGTSHTGGWA